MAAAALSRPGMAGREAALSRIPRARRRRPDSRGGPGRGDHSWRAVRCLSPAGVLSGLRGRTRLALRFLPSEAQPRDGRMTPSGSPGSQSRGGCSCAVRHRRCPHPRPDPGAGSRLGFSSLPPTLACSPRPLSSSFGRVWPRPTPTHPGHLSRPSLSLACPPLSACTLQSDGK